jgi:hypothetical protein
MVKLVISLIVMFAAHLAWADANKASPAISRATSGDSGPALTDQVRGPVHIAVRRYSSSKAGEAAYQRLEAALAELARKSGLAVAEGGEPAEVTVEVDSTFYVYTNRFNARLVRLAEYTEAQLAGKVDGKVAEASPKSVDALRIAAGAIGIVQGWISPQFGSYMMAGGAAPALFGSGDAPRRLFVPGKERYERGEQEVNTKVRVLRNGVAVGAFSIRCSTAGDEAPFLIDALVADNWSGMLDILRGSTVQTTAIAQ